MSGSRLVTAILIGVTVTLSFVVQALERRFRIPGLGIEQVKRLQGGRIAPLGG